MTVTVVSTERAIRSAEWRLTLTSRCTLQTSDTLAATVAVERFAVTSAITILAEPTFVALALLVRHIRAGTYTMVGASSITCQITALGTREW